MSATLIIVGFCFVFELQATTGAIFFYKHWSNLIKGLNSPEITDSLKDS